MNETAKPAELSDAQRRMIAALLEERNISRAAEKASVARSRYYAWMDEDQAFRAEVQAARRHFAEEGLDRLVGLFDKAVERLGEALDSKDATIKLRASSEIARLTLELRRTVELETKIAELEERARMIRGGELDRS